MSIADITTEEFNAQMAQMSAAHPGAVVKSRPHRRAAWRAVRRGGRAVGRTVLRGWVRVRGALGSLLAGGTIATAVFIGFGLVAGLFAVAGALLWAEWLLGGRR